jgi:zinc protease
MRRPTIQTVLRLAALATFAAAGNSFPQVTSYKDIKTPPMHVIRIEQPQRIELPNGMIIFLEEDHELPLIQAIASIRGGARDVAAAKSGLIDVYGEVWRTGGTATKSGDELDDLLESHAAHVEASVDTDSTSLSMNVLKGDFDLVFPIFADLLRAPAFRQEKIDLAKNQANAGIARRNDNVQEIAPREAARLVYGASSPYTRIPEYSTVASITREDLVAFHDRFATPGNIILGLVGDFDATAMAARLRETFASWPRGQQAPPPPTDVHPAKPGVYFVAKNDVTQSNVYLVEPGIVRNNPDYVPLQVMNEIFSGGFSGRLMNHLRTDRGLAYSVDGGVGAEWDHPGVTTIALGTKSGTTVEAITALRSEVSDLLTKPVQPEELALARSSLLNSFVFRRDSKRKILNERMNLEFYGYPADFYDRYRAAVENVTADDVVRVARKYVQPDQLSVLVVGKEKDFDKPLSSLGSVTPVDITIPEPGSAAGTPAAAITVVSDPEGLALARKAQDFAGGAARLAAIHSIRQTQTVNAITPQGPMTIDVESTLVYPDSMRSVMKMPMGQMSVVVTPDSAFMDTPMGARDLPASQRDSAMADVKSDDLAVLRNVGQPGYTYNPGGTEKIGAVDTRILNVIAAGSQVRLWIDPQTGRIYRRAVKAKAPGSSGENITDYSEWKTFDGITIPVKASSTVDGKPMASVTITNLEVNPTVDPKLFQRPPAK